MSIENVSVIDFVSIDKEAVVKLSISDHLDWTDEVRHMIFLQEKINNYCTYINNGQLYEEYPAARDRCVVISLVYFHDPTVKGEAFLAKVRGALGHEGIAFEWKIYQGPKTV